MKTIEEKAKAYDEALEKAAQLIENCGDNNGCKEMIRSIFPELVEIEDERIKYCLISLIASETAYDEFEKYNVDYDSVYAWLAKQGEQKLVLTAKEAWKDMRLEVYAQASGNRHEPNVSDDSTKMFSLNDIDEIFEKISDAIVEQKPAEWSEEDSKRLQRIIDFLWYNRKGDTDTIYQQEQDIAWLKSLRPQN